MPENRAQPEGRQISIRVAVIPARDGGSKRDPLVHITGGPGGSSIADAAGMLSIFSTLNASRDVVLVDQRGTGASNPLTCPAPPRGFQPTDAAAVRRYMTTCFEALPGDPLQYTTAPAMDDLADVVRALGYEEINLYGVSYGATAAQYFLAQHDDLVRTATLDGATLLDVPIFELWGRNGQRALSGILDRCTKTKACARKYPRVRREAFEVIAALRKKPVRIHGTRIDAATAAGALQSLSRSPAGAARIPWVAHSARVGDWLPLELTIADGGIGSSTPAGDVLGDRLQRALGALGSDEDGERQSRHISGRAHEARLPGRRRGVLRRAGRAATVVVC